MVGPFPHQRETAKYVDAGVIGRLRDPRYEFHG